MKSYQQQKSPGSTVFRAKSIKEAMAEARLAFGAEAEILSVEKVGKLYCVEVSPPRSLDAATMSPIAPGTPFPRAQAASSTRREPVLAPAEIASARTRAAIGRFDATALESVERLERQFVELAARVDLAKGHQGSGLEAIGSIRASLADAGFAEPFVGKLAGAMVDAGAVAYSKDLAMRILASWLGQLGEASDMEMGWHAVVGPAGSGKTTTIAKLASRAAAKYGPDSVGLVTTDFFRIGAYEQLRVFGELLGVKVHPARSLPELTGLVDSLASKKVVYVDTVGSSRDDDKMREQMGMLAALGIQSSMALQACLARSVMRVDLARWREGGASSALITKLDQATGIAALVESLIMRGMPVHYAATGQRVPADLHKVTGLLLAHKAMRDEPKSVVS